MSKLVSFSKEVEQFLHSRLASLGFEKRTSGIMTIRISEEVLGWIGLNKATGGSKDDVEVNPVVGVRNQRIETLVADLLEKKFDKVIPPTLAGHIGYMKPSNKYAPYFFSRDASLEPPAQALIGDVRDYGIPFIQTHSDVVALIEGLRTCRFAIDYMAEYRIPAGLFLLGLTEEAQAALDAALKKTGDRQDPAALRFRFFAANFAAKLGRGTGA